MEPFVERRAYTGDVTLSGVLIGVAVVMMLITGVVIMAKWTRSADPPLDQDDVFMKAQFCIQTGRIPLIVTGKVTCDDYKHGHRQEEAP